MLLIKPYLGCNLNCKYCYQRNIRKRMKPEFSYNLNAIFKKMKEYKALNMALHGGEPLALPKKDVERILAKMFEIKGRSSIQTNGTLIDDDFIRMFKKYKTNVGISYDGPGILSEFRPGTASLNEKIEKLREEGIQGGLIIVVSKANAGNNYRLKKLKEYLLELHKLNTHGRLHPCANAPGCELEEKRLIDVFLNLAKFCVKNRLRWSPFADIVWGLQGKSRVCTFMGCDIFSTPAATVILGDGSETNCLRASDQNQKILLRHPIKYNTRDEILKQVSQKYGGCKDCRYFSACHGGCPSSTINDDWRNRTYFCSLWKTLFRYFEQILRSNPEALDFLSKRGSDEEKTFLKCQQKAYVPI